MEEVQVIAMLDDLAKNLNSGDFDELIDQVEQRARILIGASADEDLEGVLCAAVIFTPTEFSVSLQLGQSVLGSDTYARPTQKRTD